MRPNSKSLELAQYILLCISINSYCSKFNSLQKNIDTNERFQGSIQLNTPKLKGSWGMLSAHQYHSPLSLATKISFDNAIERKQVYGAIHSRSKGGDRTSLSTSR